MSECSEGPFKWVAYEHPELQDQPFLQPILELGSRIWREPEVGLGWGLPCGNAVALFLPA
jgi:hypothetical protein